MRVRIMLLFAGLVCLLGVRPAQAQWWENKWEVTPFVGYETNGNYPLRPTSSAIDVNNFRLDGSTSFGTFIDYSLTRNAQLEFMWDRNKTQYSVQPLPGDPYTKAFGSDVDQYQWGGLYMLMGDEHRLRPYIAGSVGFTHEFNSGGVSNRTDFSYSIGGGVKYELSRHIALRGDARFMPTYANSSLETFCDPFFGCYTAKVSNFQNRGNFVAGIVFKF